MSQVSDIYELLKTTVETALPNHKSLNNPYFPENDAELTYDAAYGIAFGPSSDLRENLNSGILVRERSFTITLTKRKFATARDKEARIDTEKELMDDWTSLVNAIATDKHLGNKTLVNDAYFTDDGGIEFLTLDRTRNNILLIRSNIQVRYHERVTLKGC